MNKKNLFTNYNSNFSDVGKVSWLWMNSPLHRPWTVELLSRFVLPAIESSQYLLIERDGLPVAYCSWAFLNQSAEANYLIDSSRIRAEDWVGGDRLWFVDWVAPFSWGDSISMKNQLVNMFPHSLARAIRVKNGKSTARVMEFRGRKLDPNEAATLLNQYYVDFLSLRKQKSNGDQKR